MVNKHIPREPRKSTDNAREAYSRTVARRSYQQFCSMATALDVIGERWTLLIVRELMLGPQRFKDLLDGLPGIGRNLLSARLKHLEAEGLVARRRLPPPAASAVYELTEEGGSLGPVMSELGRWGAERLGPREPGQHFRAGWAMFPLSYMADREAAQGLDEVYEFRVDEETFHLRVRDGDVQPRAGSAGRAEMVAKMDTATLADLLAQTLTPVQAIAQGRVSIDGSPEALQHALALWPEEPAEP